MAATVWTWCQFVSQHFSYEARPEGEDTGPFRVARRSPFEVVGVAKSGHATKPTRASQTPDQPGVVGPRAPSHRDEGKQSNDFDRR